MWLHILVGPFWCVYVALFGSRQYAATSPYADVFYLAILTTVTLASTSNALPDDGVTDCTETCRSCFNVNFNVNFTISFKTIHLFISS
jgi:hypothetical protein